MNEINYRAMINFERFKNLFLAQNKKYYRKMGIFCSIFFIPFTILLICAFIYEPSGKGILYILTSLLLVGLGILLIFKPLFIFHTRKNIVTGWFRSHGLKKLEGGFSNYKVEYDVNLSKYGVTEKFVSRVEIRFPWFSFTGKYVESPEGVYFTYDDGKNSSLVYNMLGVNYLFRDELQGEILFIEKEVLDKNPNLVEEIKKSIEDSKKIYKNRNISQEEKEKMSKWITSVNKEK